MPTVLYVDSQPALARAVQRWLAGRGTDVRPARSIAEAKQRLASGAYDGVFIDLWLKDGSGFELYDWIVERHPSLAGRVAFISADVTQDPGSRRQLGLIDQPVILKPFALEELDRCVDRWATVTTTHRD